MRLEGSTRCDTGRGVFAFGNPIQCPCWASSFFPSDRLYAEVREDPGGFFPFTNSRGREQVPHTALVLHCPFPPGRLDSRRVQAVESSGVFGVFDIFAPVFSSSISARNHSPVSRSFPFTPPIAGFPLLSFFCPHYL